jgi:hypothetical protein
MSFAKHQKLLGATSLPAEAFPPIDHARGQIRLLLLKPGAFHEVIRLHLFTAELGKLPRYEALSYVWGEDISEAPVVVGNGLRVCLTANLELALRYLRHPLNARTLWVDAVCIDQCHIEERNHQVNMMRTIYSSADRVLVWLGAPEPDSDFVMDAINSTIQVPPSERLRLRFALRSLCERPWFFRIWVVQELVVARADPVVVCGARQVQWSAFVTALKGMLTLLKSEVGDPEAEEALMASWETLVDHYLDQPWTRVSKTSVRQLYSMREAHCKEEVTDTMKAFLRVKAERVARASIRETHTQLERCIIGVDAMDFSRRTCEVSSLGAQLAATLGRKASDPRDRVYALLGITSFADEEPLVPNYGLPIEGVYTQAISRIIRHEFIYGYPFYPLLSDHNRPPNWPSWVPDLSGSHPNTGPHGLVPQSLVMDLVHERSPDLGPLATYSNNDRVMTTLAAPLGRVVFATNVEFDRSDEVPFVLERLKTQFAGKVPPQLLLEALAAHDDRFKARRGELERDFVALWGRLGGATARVFEEGRLQWVLDVFDKYRCTLFITDSGRIGRAPQNGVKEGDALMGLFGIGFPMILRGQRKQSATHQMVCVAYVARHKWGQSPALKSVSIH